MQAKSYYYWGCIRRDQNNHPEALKKFFTAITHAQSISDNKLAGYIYSNIANLYLLQRLNEQADSIYQITERLAIQEKDSNLLADVLSQRGMIDINRGKEYYSEAEQKILLAFKISRHIAQRNLMAKTAYSLSLLYGRMNMGKEAVEFAKLSLNNQDNVKMLYRGYLLLGDAYYKTVQYDSALIYLNKALYSRDHSTKAGIYMRLADIAQKQGKLEQALEMERKYSAYLDSAQQKQQGAAIVITEKNILIQRKQSEFKTNLGQLYYYITTGTAFFLALFLVLLKCYKKKVIYYKQKEIEMGKKLEEVLRQKNEQISDSTTISLCVSDAEFSDTHQADTNLTLPACNADDLEYYRQIGRYMDTFDATQILWEMETDIEETKEYSEFKFATDDLMAQVMEARPELLDKASGYLCSYYGLGSVKYTYSEDTATIKLTGIPRYIKENRVNDGSPLKNIRKQNVDQAIRN